MRAILVLGVLAAVATLAVTPTVHAQPPNPIVGDTGRYVTTNQYDPFSNNYVTGTNRDMTRASAYDPNRNVIDPGTYQYVNRWVTDEYGRRVQEYGYTWTSYGVPHGNLKRVQTTYTPPAQPYNPYYPPGTIQQNTTSMVYGPQQPGQIQQNTTGMVYGPQQPGQVQQNTTGMYYSGPPNTQPSTPGTIQRNTTGMRYSRPQPTGGYIPQNSGGMNRGGR
ncbi:MAG: hypothetical protein ABI353_06725 [Isosphaeraceae bacterium]